MTNEEITKKAYEAYPTQSDYRGQGDEYRKERNAYIRALTEIESLPKIHGWVARDKNGRLNFFLGEPRRIINTQGVEYWVGHARMKQPNQFLPELTWDDDPIEVELIIRPVKKEE